MKLVIEVEINNETSTLSECASLAARTMLGFMNSINGDPDLRGITKQHRSYYSDKNANLIVEGGFSEEKITCRVGVAHSDFDTSNWGKERDPSTLRRGEVDPEGNVIELKPFLGSVDPSAVHD